MKEKFNFKKKYGQNFLIDKNIVGKIISSVNPTSNDLIIEIGPGSGNLTRELKKYNADLVAYEIDLDTKSLLDDLSDMKTTIIFDDFLKRDIKSDIRNISYDNLYVIANLPYYITTPIIEKIIKEGLNPKEMTLMVQKEVADRLSAKPKTKEYGYITVFLNYYFDIEKLFNVPKGAFKPVPKVDSAVLKFKSHQRYKTDEAKFNELIKKAFMHKRKTLNNNLKGYDSEKLREVLNKYELSPAARAEELPIEAFIDLVKYY